MRGLTASLISYDVKLDSWSFFRFNRDPVYHKDKVFTANSNFTVVMQQERKPPAQCLCITQFNSPPTWWLYHITSTATTLSYLRLLLLPRSSSLGCSACSFNFFSLLLMISLILSLSSESYSSPASPSSSTSSSASSPSGWRSTVKLSQIKATGSKRDFFIIVIVRLTSAVSADFFFFFLLK